MSRHLAPIFAGTGLVALLIVGACLALGLNNGASESAASGVVAPVVGVTTAAQPTVVPTHVPAVSPKAAPVAASQSFAALLPSDEAASAAPAPLSTAPTPVITTASRTASAPVELPVRLKIDSIGLDTKVINTGVVGGVWQVADFAAGYMSGTGLPGQAGNVAVAGHDDIQGEVFRHLKSVTVGDPIALSTANHQYRYLVDSIRYVSPDDVSVLDASPDPRLTLITCWPDFATAKAAYNSLRLVVGAKLVS